jgi:nitrogenase molybdenum-iron protein alpha/beta subunit
VGYLWDRNEADHRSNVQELRRLLEGLSLDLETCWLSGSDTAGLVRAARAGTVLSFPYGREAAQILASRTETRLLECRLPISLEGTIHWIESVASHLGRQRKAQAFIEQELSLCADHLKWILPHALAGRRVAVISDPHLAGALVPALLELGCQVPVCVHWASSVTGDARDSAPDSVLLLNPSPEELGACLQEACQHERLDLIVTNSHALLSHAGLGEGQLPFLELGFPSFYSHALYDRPWMGFNGVLQLVSRIANAFSQAEVRRWGRQKVDNP